MRLLFRTSVQLLLLMSAGCSWFAAAPPPPTPLEVAREAAEKSRAATEALKNSSAAPQVRWTFSAMAIEIRLKGDSKLNVYDGESHSLAVAVYQLSDPNLFGSYCASREKIIEIMNAYRFDPSVLTFEQFYLQPGEERVIRLNRAENSRYVGIVAAYYKSDPDQSARLFEIPVVVTPGREGLLAAPGALNINIFAGSNMIQQYGSN
jgi:type VI secretion system VasD/TssJ family lipoprotein